MATGFDPASVHLDDDADRRRLVDERHQEDEANNAVLATAGGLTTRSQVRGSLIGTVIGTVVGALITIPLWFVPPGLPVGSRIGIWLALGVLAGSTVGFVYGGSRLPQLRREHTDPGPGTTVSVDVSSDAEAALARSILTEQARRRALAREARSRGGTGRARPGAAGRPRGDGGTTGDEP